MAEVGCFNTMSQVISFFVLFVFVTCSVPPVLSSRTNNFSEANQTFRSHEELQKLKILMKVNKPAVKTIHSPDGDLIDCVVAHQQPAFDHPLLRGQKPLDPPQRPKGHNPRETTTLLSDNYNQLWRMSGETCPQGTVPIRRTTESDILRASSFKKFGRKFTKPPIQTESTSSNSNGHEYAIGYLKGEEYYGGKATINVWEPNVEGRYEFSVSQLWAMAGSYDSDLNTVEAGWQVSRALYGDNRPRLFTYWTRDAYKQTGCYNLLCSGFVQTSSKIAVGAAIAPVSSYNGGQFDVTLLVWKDPRHGDWWLEYSGNLVGYWPSSLFTHLKDHADGIEYGGEIINSRTSGSHTSTQMGSGHFSGEGFRKASFFRNLYFVNRDNGLVPSSNLQKLATDPNCYDIEAGSSSAWGTYFYYGGPGRISKCP